MDERRASRVSLAVKEELSELIGFEASDPRLQVVEVIDAQVSPDGRHATVRVALRGTEKENRDALKALDGAANFLRHELASRLTLRNVPELHFNQDSNPDIDTRIDILLKRAKKSRGRTEN